MIKREDQKQLPLFNFTETQVTVTRTPRGNAPLTLQSVSKSVPEVAKAVELKGSPEDIVKAFLNFK